MITIEYQKEKESRHVKYNLSLEGHAGYAPVGQDIVCSAVSILLFTLANALSDSGVEDLDVSLEPGDSHISCTATYADIEIDTLFRFTVIGLELLEEQYPENVEFLAED